jgi:syntaxin 5
MNSQVDCRDRTAEFFSTVAQIQRAQHALLHGSAAGSAAAALDGTSHRPLPASFTAFSASSAAGSNFHSEFDERPDEALLGTGGSRSNNNSFHPPQPPQPKQQSQFTQAAQHIGRSIHLVTSKLEKLGKLARQRSLFNDPASEINELTFVIKTDLATLHQELEVLHAWVMEQRNGAKSQGGAHAVRNSSAIVDSLKVQLMSTTKNFQEVLQVRTQALKEQHQRRKQFETGGGGGGSSSSASASSAAAATSSNAAPAVGNAQVRKRVGLTGFDALMSQAASAAAKQQQQQNGGIVGPDNEAPTRDDDDSELSFMTPGAAGGIQSQQLVQQQAQDQTDEYLSSRAKAVEDIESTIVQLGEMYARLVHLIGMQDEVVVRIDTNMDHALEHMDKGQQELFKYYDSIKGSKWLIIKVFAALLAFIVFFMIFVA